MTRPALLVLVLLGLPGAGRAEICRFGGETSQGGRLAVRTETSEAGGRMTVDVRLEFTVHAWMTEYRYLGQEITEWTAAGLQSIAVNQRNLADGRVKRQQWDVFARAGDGLEARRAQAKYVADLRQRHAGLMAHWPAESFGRPWLADFARANPERRPDLDLPATDARTPLALAFYWSRFLPPEGAAISLVLPSFKRNKTTTLRLGAAVPGEGWRRWSTELQHAGLAGSPASVAAAWVSPENYLMQLGLEVHTRWVSGTAVVRAQGCEGVQLKPPERAR